MLRCNEVAMILASDQLQDAGWMRRLSLRMHLAMCRRCRRYAKQIALLGDQARRMWTATAADESALQRIEETLRNRSADGS